MPAANTITVTAGPKLKPGQVAIWEKDAEHPKGEVYLAAPHEGEEPETIEVARTGEVSKRLSDGRLAEVHRSSRRAPDPEPDAPARAASPPASQTEPPAPPAPPANPLDAPGLLTDQQRTALAEAGIVTADDVRRVNDDDLESVEGIGPATVARLRAAVGE